MPTGTVLSVGQPRHHPSKQTAQSGLGWSEVGVRAVSLESITLSEPENQENTR